MNNHTIYSADQLVKEYGARRVVDVRHLAIHRGEIFGIVGPSGAGKSTLLRLLNFLERPSLGNLVYGNEVLGPNTDVPLATLRSVTTVFQRPVLLNKTVRDNVAIGLRLRGIRHYQADLRAALEEVGLSELMNQRAHTLSGGEAQRVALARAMVLNPDVLLLDEPTANLDPYNIGLIETIITRINREHRTTIVMVTHNVFQARRLADRVGLMLDGQLIEIADTESFFESPSDPRTAAFVAGEMIY